MEIPQATLSDAKNFLLSQRNGLLSTISVSQKGYPFGSIAPYDIDENLNVYIYVSLIAEHYRNLCADARASLMAVDPFGSSDQQAHARATLLAEFKIVQEVDRDAIRKRYEERFPGSINYEIAHNFVFMRGTPVKLRWIGGFGDIKWIDAKKLAAAPADILAYGSHDILQHMNEDHSDALADFVRAHSSFNPDEFTVLMTQISAHGFTITLRKATRTEKVIINFPAQLNNFEEVRPAIVQMLKVVRSPKAP